MSEMEIEKSTAPAEDQSEMIGEYPTGGDAQPPHQSATLAAIEESRRPPPEIACVTCPMCLWFLSGTELQGYCKQMYLISWATSKPGAITLCDGPTAELL